MKIEALQKKLKQISKAYFNDFRVQTTYGDVQNLISLIKCIKADLRLNNLQDVIAETKSVGDESELLSQLEKKRQLGTLLQALYIFSDIFINVFLQEILDKRDARNGTESMLKKYYEKLTASEQKQEKFLPAFCIVSYRNKIVVHQDQYRANGVGMDADGKVKLITFKGPFQTSFDEDKIKRVKELKQKYLQEIPDLSQNENGPTVLTTLFYNVPVYQVNQFNNDRDELHKLIETGGCESYDNEQLVEHLDDFINTICQTHIYLN